MRVVPACTLPLLLVACASAPQSARPAPAVAAQTAAQPPPRPDVWAQYYLADLNTQANQLRNTGLQAEWDAVRARVETFLPQRDTRGVSGATPAQLREIEVLRTTNTLVDLGYRTRHLAHSAQATTLIRAADSGWSDADAIVLVSAGVVLADLVRTERNPDASVDMIWRVTEVIKGPAAPGFEFRYRLSAPFPQGSGKPGDPPPPPPLPLLGRDELAGHGKAIFFLQTPNPLTTRTERPDHEATRMFGPMPVTGNRVLPGYHSVTAETTLDSLRAAAQAQLCSPGYVPLAKAADPPQSC